MNKSGIYGTLPIKEMKIFGGIGLYAFTNEGPLLKKEKSHI